MNNENEPEVRSEPEIVADLESLSQERGYIYSFCRMVDEYLWMKPNDPEIPDWHSQLNLRELTFLLGLMVKYQLTVTDPPTKWESDLHINKTNELFHELHQNHAFPKTEEVNAAQVNLEDWESGLKNTYTDWIKSGKGIVEPVFYGEEGAYDFQFLKMAAWRYRFDNQWIKSKIGIDVNSMTDIAGKIKQFTEHRINDVTRPSDFRESCLRLLSVFLIKPNNVPGANREEIEVFLETFSVEPGDGVNQNLDTIGKYNTADSHPIIKISNDLYFIPIYYNLAKSIYENPFYWILKDNDYKQTGLKNRGDVTEEIAFELLRGVFGIDNVFRGVKVQRGNRDITDIDVLAVCGSKAVIVQVKSKKLTELSRRGDRKSIEKDFKHAVQDAYNQALLSRNYLLETDETLTVNEERVIQVKENIDDAYIICATGDHYPAINIQTKSYLKKKATDPYPVVQSVFDLETISFYLRDPYDFIYYARQRTIHASHFEAESEMAFLGFHLNQKLFPTDGYDVTVISRYYAHLIDLSFPVLKGEHPFSDSAFKVFHKWKNDDFDVLVNEVKVRSIGHPQLTDLIFFLFDLAGSVADKIFTVFGEIKRTTRHDLQPHDATIPISHVKKGVTLFSYPSTHVLSEPMIQEQFRGFAVARKYKCKASEWLALGSCAQSSNLIDCLWYSKEEWCYDENLERLSKILLKQGRAIRTDGRKIGRNSPCPCGSGLKFKKCHGK